ncbi:thioredoxin family protein [filamentous cyanobacterium LEGE 11480]|uniref:Thioredoxin family protein n=1 Tax=Romeriopsis navalis LEGE 11480 TaxID=2777977 RepID=A0A928VLS8_9CYAN|nr:thioredoxin family protein [Romeriopsis navalis]MBE9028976.1 thioredoxin family protein [Romeriopsis navalis LEGE 11480]
MTSVVDEQAFSREVLESSTPVLVHFWAPWCGVCRMIEPVLETLVRAPGAQLKLVGVNADENLKLASDYRITNLPTVMLIKEGKVLYRFDQLDRRDQILPLLKGLLPGAGSKMELID